MVSSSDMRSWTLSCLILVMVPEWVPHTWPLMISAPPCPQKSWYLAGGVFPFLQYYSKIADQYLWFHIAKVGDYKLTHTYSFQSLLNQSSLDRSELMNDFLTSTRIIQMSDHLHRSEA